jgi:NADH dehydrogenase/NADH:ubiquinone oxidoreductase subunit G
VFANLLRPRQRPNAPAAFWPRADDPWPLQGSIESIAGSKTIVLVGLDAWFELPVLALWIRRAVQRNGARLVVIGAGNGLYRDTAAWLRTERGAEGEAVQGLLDAQARAAASGVQAAAAAVGDVVARVAGDERRAQYDAAAALLDGRPASLLVGPQVARDPLARALVEQLAAALEAGEPSGMVGSPALAANGRGAAELAPDLAAADVAGVLADATTLFLVGQETWPDTGSARLVVASTTVPESPDAVDVLLPLAHPYEQVGSLTNLEGRVQQLNAGGGAPPSARMDWELLAHLAGQLGATLRPDVLQVRAALAEAHPRYAAALSGGLPRSGRLLAATGSARG